jgi:drug/metabolite transporter (DMT)-like permease
MDDPKNTDMAGLSIFAAIICWSWPSTTLDSFAITAQSNLGVRIILVSKSSPSLLLRLAPALFVAIWSTGWVSARYGADYADPLTFLSARFVLAFAAMLVIIGFSRAEWPKGRGILHAMMSGVLLHALYLGGVWWAIAHGVPTGISGLVAAIQPILTAFLAPLILRERIGPLQWAGIFLGFAGIVFVLEPKLSVIDPAHLAETLEPLAINMLAMVSVTFGTFYQKRFIPKGDLRTVTALQYAGAFIVVTPAALLLEPLRLDWGLPLIAVMAWSVLALSLGAIGLLLLLIREGAVSRAAALIYLVPPSVAIEAWIAFGETMQIVQLVGLGLTVLGVALATRRPGMPK